eukprot:scaffold80013_cov69-Phaeocystis_antarctica.AAC.1
MVLHEGVQLGKLQLRATERLVQHVLSDAQPIVLDRVEERGGQLLFGHTHDGSVACRRCRCRIEAGEQPSGYKVGEDLDACDAGGVEAQRLVERRRDLPRVERRACGAGRGAGREAGGAAGDRGARTACREGLDCRSGARHGEERTLNMETLATFLTTRFPVSWTPSITGSHHSWQATPSSFSTRSPAARSVAVGSSDAL